MFVQSASTLESYYRDHKSIYMYISMKAVWIFVERIHQMCIIWDHYLYIFNLLNMKLYVQNKYPNVSSNYLNYMQKTVRTFMGRRKEWFEFSCAFHVPKLFLITCKSTRINCADAVHENKFFMSKEYFLHAIRTGIFFLNPFQQSKKWHLGHHI